MEHKISKDATTDFCQWCVMRRGMAKTGFTRFSLEGFLYHGSNVSLMSAAADDSC